MATPQQLPWAILLCRFSDDLNDPAKTTISDLDAQWLAESGPAWIMNNIPPSAVSDPRTILEVYNAFFTPQGAGTFNAVRYWDEMSHGNIDVSGTKIFPCKLPVTKAEGAKAAISPGGAAYQNDIFKKAKQALQQQYGVNAKDFYGVAVSFQSPDNGAQGGMFDGGPGVFMDIRFVIGNGIQAWGQEMGHAFGLDHSRAQGSDDDYRDPWDVMSTRAAYSGPDPFYTMRGPGINAWNMRGRQWLDENRIWKAPSANDFSQTISIRPLHRRDLSGYLGAELPAIGNDSAYLVEFRVPKDWDNGIGDPVVLVHRFQGPIGQFLGSHSYLMQGTAGQYSLGTGGHFESGTGPFSHVKVLVIDVANDSATIELCYSASQKITPTVQIVPATAMDDCWPVYAQGNNCKFLLKLSAGPCAQDYTVLWNVIGAMPSPGVKNDGPSYEVVLPDPSVLVEVSVSVTFADRTMISGSLQFHSISLGQANWLALICSLLKERQFPTPWWQLNPAALRPILRPYSHVQLQALEKRVESILETVRQLARQ